MPNLKLSKVSLPFTPIRRLLHDVLRPTVAIGKRMRDIDEDQGDVGAEHQELSSSRNCVALQSEDTEEDAVVITALAVVPFCCHADLLLMDREQLVAVADNLNAKLPLAMQIDTAPARTDSFIRHSIELLVGIRHAVPQAPKANRSLSLSVSNLDFHSDSVVTSVLPLSPVSPLATRKRQAAAVPEYAASAPLASLQEENEGFVEAADRPPKRRRIDERGSPDASPTPLRRKVLRSQSQRAGGVQPRSFAGAQNGRVLRSRSERLPPLQLKGTHRNVTVARGRASTKFKHAVPVMTSTPKSRNRESLADHLQSTDNLGVAASDSLSSTPRMERVGIWLARTKEANNDSDARRVTSGMKNMTLEAFPSDMEICSSP